LTPTLRYSPQRWHIRVDGSFASAFVGTTASDLDVLATPADFGHFVYAPLRSLVD
jgi:beta-xylosidase